MLTGLLSAATPPLSGRPLREVLEELRAGGLNVLYSDGLVRDDMVVREEPAAATPIRLLEQLLKAHGLRLRAGPGKSWLVVRDRATVTRGRLRGQVQEPDGRPLGGGAQVWIGRRHHAVLADAEGWFEVELPAGRYTVTASAPGHVTRRLDDVSVAPDRVAEVRIRLPRPMLQEAVLVDARTPGRELIDPPRTLGAEEIDRAPRLSDDAVQTVARLPGTADSDLSSRLNVRGGHDDELMLVLDGLEIFDPVHLQDVEGGRLGLIGAASVGRLDYVTGAIPARYGNHLSGVLDMSSVQATGPARTSLTLAVDRGAVASQGRFDEDRGAWFFSARVGFPEYLLPTWLPEQQYDPRYGDALARVQYRILPRTTLALNVLYAVDETTSYGDFDVFDPDPAEGVGVGSQYGNRNAWATFDTAWSGRLSSRFVLSAGELDRTRQVRSEEELAVRDDRDVEFGALSQDWSWSPGDRHEVEWGATVRSLRARYDYDAQDLDPAEDPPAPASVAVRPDGLEYAVYLADVWRVRDDLALEAGLRWDGETYTDVDDAHLGPRVGLAYSAGPHTRLRGSWARLYQSQRIHQLQVEDGVDRFFGAEEADTTAVGLDRTLTSELSLGLAAYHKRVRDVRPRYENLFDPGDLLPEAAADRVLVAPDHSVLRGVELMLQGTPHPLVTWTAGYALAEAEDTINGAGVPRSWDQRHAADVTLVVAAAERWSVSLAGSYHSGRPTTPVSAVTIDGEVVFVPGARNTARLDAYYRADLRAQRAFTRGRHRVELFVDAFNLLDRANVCCVSGFDAEPDGAGGFLARPRERTGLARTVDGGVHWQF